MKSLKFYVARRARGISRSSLHMRYDQVISIHLTGPSRKYRRAFGEQTATNCELRGPSGLKLLANVGVPGFTALFPVIRYWLNSEPLQEAKFV